MSLTTLAAVQNQIKGTEAAKATGTNQQIMSYIRTVTGRVLTYNFKFEPYFYTRKITPTKGIINSYRATLTLGDMLLECTSITVGGTSYSYGSQILPYPNDGTTPIRALRIASPSSGPLQTWYPCCTSPDTWFESIQVTGFWGMRTNYATMGFWDSGLTCPALTATQLSFTTQAFNGLDPYYRTPILSPGNLIRVDNELMEVTNTSANTTDLNVIRGAQGTTAVAHNNGTAIKVFEPEEDIQGVATDQAALLYARRGSYTEVQAGGVIVSYPSDLLASLRAAVQKYNYAPYAGGGN